MITPTVAETETEPMEWEWDRCQSKKSRCSRLAENVMNKIDQSEDTYHLLWVASVGWVFWRLEPMVVAPEHSSAMLDY